MATIEYRKLFRANVCLRIHYSVLKPPHKKGITFSRNISSTGINVIILDSLSESDELNLEIFFPNDPKPVVAKGKVIWQRACSYQPKSPKKYYSTGIHFMEMAAEDAIKTSDFIGDVLRIQKESEDKSIIEKIEGLVQAK